MFAFGNEIFIILILMVLGGGAAVLALIVLAVSKGRLGLAALIGGLAFLFVVGVMAMIGFFFAMRADRSVAVSVPMWQGGPITDTTRVMVNGMPAQVQGSSNSIVSNTISKMAFVPFLFIAGGVVALIVIAARRGLAHSAVGGHGKIWPSFLVLSLLALFLFGNVRYQRSTSFDAEQAARQSEMIQQQQLAVMKQQQAMATHAAAMSSDLQHRIANMDIHELMDQFDAPRIALQAASSPTAASAALVFAAAAPAGVTPTAQPAGEATSGTTVKTSKDEYSANSHKDRTQSKRKRPTKAPSNSTDVAVAKEATATADAATPPDVTAAPKSVDGSRPAWINSPSRRVGDVQKEVVVTDEWSTEEECDRARSIGLMLKTYEHIQRLVGADYKGYLLDHGMSSENAWNDFRLAQLASAGINTDYVLRDIAKDEYVETVERSVGPMKKMYTLVEFSPAVDADLLQRWSAALRRERFAYVGVGAASVLGLLSMVWGLLKVDTATKGYYTKWLFIGVPIAIIGVMLILLLATGHLPLWPVAA